MKHICLRDCYVGDRFWRKGETYELPDDMVKSEKNFQPLGEPAPEGPDLPGSEPKPKPEPVKPEKIPAGMFWCGKHNTLHKLTSSVGKKCLRRIEAAEAEAKAKAEAEQEPVKNRE